MGRFGDFRLLTVAPTTAPSTRWFAGVFGDEKVQPIGAGIAVRRGAAGAMGHWLSSQATAWGIGYRYVTLEFGTYPPWLGLKRLNDRRLGRPGSDGMLRECFAPASEKWRRRTVEQGTEVVMKLLAQVERGDSTDA